ncbi:MAG: hypothetical protein P8181_04945 [bacterium]
MTAFWPVYGAETRKTGLDSLLTPAEREFLLSELSRVEPPERLRELADYGRHQLELGGGFYGMLPDQLADPDSIPLPTDAVGRLEAALCLARQRAVNLAALTEIDPDYALSFSGESLMDFLERTASEKGTPAESIDGLSLELDTSALDGFFNAVADGEVTMNEATALAALPSNQAMLEHRRNLGYVPEPLPDTESLAKMVHMAGSSDPLDRLWCWINPQNAFGYADLAQNAADYTRFLSDLDGHRRQLVEAVLTQIGSYSPANISFETRFAFTVGWAIRGWATPEMAGLNLEQVKDDWDLLFGTLVEETYHRLQLQLCPTNTGEPAREFSDLVAVDTGDAKYDRLYEIITYTVLEGSANLVRGRFAAADLADKAPAGAVLMSRFVDEVVEQDGLESADALISEGLQGNGPLYGLGWKLASLIADKDGKRALAEYLKRGPVQFFLRGAALADHNGTPLLTPEVIEAVNTLESRLAR